MESKPCTMCLEAMLKFGVSKIIYSTGHGRLVKVKIKSLIGKTMYSKGIRILRRLNY